MRYIDADALMKELEREVELADDWKTAHEIANIVKYFPTTEIEPRHAHWIEVFPFIICSHCDKSVDIEYGGYWENTDEHIFPKYCGYCGAKMDMTDTGRMDNEGIKIQS